MAKQYMFDVDARARIASGAKKLADAVRVTLGPAGRNVILQKSFDVSRLDNSGMTIRRNAKAKGFGIVRTARWEHAFDSFAVAGRPGGALATDDVERAS